MPDGDFSGRTLRSVIDLVQAGLVTDSTELRRVAQFYAIAVPPALRALIETPNDPIGQQILPHADELLAAPHETADPVGDDALSPVKGVVHRYPDRVLIKPLLICPVYCRFCFRREHVGPDGGVLTEAELETAIDYVRQRPEIREVILTGGDPLLLSPRRLGALVQAIETVPQVETLRVHTRVPVADPGLVTRALVESLTTDKPLFLAVHANHAREFSPAALAALRLLSRQGIPLLGQSVLLRGVNDNAEVLEALFRAMLRARIKPYYLHQLDAAQGTARFHVPIAEGRALLEQLRGRITGLAWPTYVLDIPGGHGKVPVGPEYLDGGLVRDPGGTWHTLAPTPPGG
jgi:lysine 2,3-aminomutase